MKYIMGIDVGTTGAKATVFDEQGIIMVQEYQEYKDTCTVGMIDPEIIFQSVCKIIKDCTRYITDIAGICVTSFGETVVMLDGTNKVLCESILYTNAVAGDEWKYIDKKIGSKKIAEITGLISNEIYTLSKLMWIKKHQHSIYQKTKWILFVANYIEVMLGANPNANITLASRSMAYDIKKKKWSEEILNAAGLEQDKLPPITTAGDIVGELSEKMKNNFGITGKTFIIAGGHDQPCAALGLGAFSDGDAAFGLGTVECMSVVMNKPVQNDVMFQNQLVCAPHIQDGLYLTYGVLYSGGRVIKELRDKLYVNEKKEMACVYDFMMQDAHKVQGNNLLFIPHLCGEGTPQMNPTATGVLMGLTLETKRAEIVAAALEGLSFDMRLNLKNMESSGIMIKKIIAAGGGAQNEDAMKMRVTALGKSIYLSKESQAGTVGTYLIAAKALGFISDYRQKSKNSGLKFIEYKKEEETEKKYVRYCQLLEFTDLMN